MVHHRDNLHETLSQVSAMHALFDRFDLPVLTYLSSFAGRSRLLDDMMNIISQLHLLKGIALMCLFWYA